jgi:hypothetical protein
MELPPLTLGNAPPSSPFMSRPSTAGRPRSARPMGVLGARQLTPHTVDALRPILLVLQQQRELVRDP